MKTPLLRKLAFGLILALAIGSTASLVYAHSDSHGEVHGVMKERMDGMKDMAGAMKAMGTMFKGQAIFEPAVVAEKASDIAEHEKMIPELTPEGSNSRPSEALPIIWQEWGSYIETAKLLAEEGTKLAEIANEGADQRVTRVQFTKVSKTCGTCHGKYHQPRDDQQS